MRDVSPEIARYRVRMRNSSSFPDFSARWLDSNSALHKVRLVKIPHRMEAAEGHRVVRVRKIEEGACVLKGNVRTVFIAIVTVLYSDHEGENSTRIGNKCSQCLQVMKGTELQFLSLLSSRTEKISLMRRFNGSGVESIF